MLAGGEGKTCQGLRAGKQGRKTWLPDIVYEGGAEFGKKSMEQGERRRTKDERVRGRK